MIKRIIAVMAAMCMTVGSTLVPQAHEGEPVKIIITGFDEAGVEEKTYEQRKERSISVTAEELETGGQGAALGDPDGEPEEAEADAGTGSIAGIAETAPEESGKASNLAESVSGEAGNDLEYIDGAEEPDPVLAEDSGASGEDSGEEVSDWAYYGNCRITHYCSCPECTGPWYGSPTASGAWPTEFYTVATGEDLPFGTEVLIGDAVYVVEDRGVDSGEIDIFVGDHQLALDMGEYYTDVYIKG